MQRKCPSAEQLQRLAVGSLSDPPATEVESHLLECVPCQQTISGLMLSDTFVDVVRAGAGAVGKRSPGEQARLERLMTALSGVQIKPADERDAPTQPPAGAETLPPRPATEAPRTEPPPTLAAAPAAAAPANATPLGVGGALGPYQLLEKLGEGGMGAVYKARHQHLDKLVAIKVLPQHLTERADVISRFKREMKAVGKLTHANIVQAFDAGEINGTHYLAMEYVEGTDLQKLVKDKGPLSPANACRALRQAAIALAAAHTGGLVHRDVKPSNLLVAKNGQIKVLDLGLARLAGEASKATDLTAAGQAFGTPDYMAPEQWEDAREADPRTDLYALGCTLFYLLVGHAPFEDGKHTSTVSKMTAHVLDPIPDLKAARSDVPDGVAAIYQRLLAKQPGERFQSGTELAEALHPFASGKAAAAADGSSKAAPLRGDNPRGSEAVKTASPEPQVLSLRKGTADDAAVGANSAAPPNTLAQEAFVARARSARELLDLHCYQEAIVLLEEIPGAETLPGIGEVLFEARQRQFEVENLLATIRQVMRRKDRQGRQQLRAALERLRVLKPQHTEFESQLAQLERAERGRFRLPLPGLKEPLDIPWAAAAPALIVAGLMAVLGVWVIIKDKSGQEVARVVIPEGGSATVTTGDDAASGGHKSPVDGELGWHGWPADAPPPAIAPFNAAQARKHQEEWADYLDVPVEHTNSMGMKFVLIPPGEFMMGSTAAEIEAALKFTGDSQNFQAIIRSEAPRHRVILTRPIYLAMHEVTQKEYKSLMMTNPAYYSSNGPGKEAVANLNTDNHPVDTVTWNNAADFCVKLSEADKLNPCYHRSGTTMTILDETGYRLPTEAEWQFACSAGTTARYWTGDKEEELKTAAWFKANSGNKTHAVGELQANPLGLHDMHGNVWEWVQDWWEPNYNTQFSETPAINPQCDSPVGSQRVIRGGSWYNPASHCRTSGRNATAPESLANAFGFRVALSVDAVRAAQRSKVVGSGGAWHGWPADAPPPAIAPFNAKQARQHQEEWADYLDVPVDYTNSIGMKFMLIPPGEFMMGSTAAEIESALKEEPDKRRQECMQSEAPQHKVILTQPMYLGIQEITQAQYEKVTGKKPSQLDPMDTNKKDGAGTADLPVENASWNDAAEFCARLSQQEQLKPFYSRAGDTITPLDGVGYRLPSEAEWEFACRAGTIAKYGAGDQFADLAKIGWFGGNSPGGKHVAGEFPANSFGLHDMHGNLWEWVQDGWEPTFYGQFRDKPAINPGSPVSAGSTRVMRGGSWGSPAVHCRSANRYADPATFSHHHIGFRVALTVDAVRAAERSKIVSASSSPEQVIDLLKLVMVDRDAVKGKWALAAGGLSSDGSVPFCRLKLPYPPPAEYDFRVEFTAQGGNDILQLLTAGGRSFTWLMGAWGGKYDGFDTVAGHPLTREGANIIGGPTSVRRGQRHTSVIQVRRDSIAATIDGKLVVRHTTDGSDLGTPAEWDIGKNTIGLGTTFDAVVFHKVELIVPAAADAGAAWSGWPADGPKPAIAPFTAEQARQHQQAWAAHLKLPLEHVNSIGMKFILIPPGEFIMGSSPAEIKEAVAAAKSAKHPQDRLARIRSEGPQHRLILTKPFYLGQHEVTQRNYSAVMGANPSHFCPSGGGKNVVSGMTTETHPVENIPLIDTARFCVKLSESEQLRPVYELKGEGAALQDGDGYRLPTEAEWEFACRAGTTTPFYPGDREEDVLQQAWFSQNSGEQTHGVGNFRANPFGLYDMHGNVGEWVQDVWTEMFYLQFADQPAIDPLNTKIKTRGFRALRGGNWSAEPTYGRSSARHGVPAKFASPFIGMRVALSVDAVRKATDRLPPSTAAPVDLMPLIDPQRDAVAGNWRREGDALFSPSVQRARLQIPVELPNEYDLSLVVERVAGENGLHVGLAGKEFQTIAALDVGNKEKGMGYGFHFLDGKPWDENQTSARRQQLVLTSGQPHVVVCKVRSGGVQVICDDRTLIDWTGDPRRLSMDPIFSVPDSKRLFLGAWESVFRITRLELRPLASQSE